MSETADILVSFLSTRANGMRSLLLLCGLLVIASGCAHTATMTAWRPAEFDVRGIKRIAVLDFEGPHDSGDIARSALTTRLWDSQHFQLVDQSELDRVIPVSYHQGEGANVSAALDAGRSLGVDAILTGQVVSYYVGDDVTQSQRVEFINAESKDKKRQADDSVVGFGFENNETRNREASVSIAFRLIDVRTGEVIAARTTSHNFNGQQVNGQGVLPGRERILSELMDQCATDVLIALAPHRDTFRVELASTYFSKGASSVRQGNSHALAGRWGDAEAEWSAALAANQNSDEALHNLALAHELKQEFDKAIELVEQAIRVDSCSLYHRTLARLRREQEQFQVVMAQRLAGPRVESVPSSLGPVGSPAVPSSQGPPASLEELPTPTPKAQRRPF